MSADNGVNDVLKVLKISPHVRRESSIARGLLHRGLDTGLLALWDATESDSCKIEEQKMVCMSFSYRKWRARTFKISSSSSSLKNGTKSGAVA